MTTEKKIFRPNRTITPLSDELKTRYKIQSTGERNKYVRMLLSGLGGQGKTTIIGTASRRVLINEVENKMVTTRTDSNMVEK